MLKPKRKPIKYFKAVKGKWVRLTNKEIRDMQTFKVTDETLVGIKAKCFPVTSQDPV